MTEPKDESPTPVQFEKLFALGSKLVGTLFLLLAGFVLCLIASVIGGWPGIPIVLRWAAAPSLACGGLFILFSLMSLWCPKFPPRLYTVAERCFYITVVVTLPTLTVAVLWQAIRAK